MSKKLGWIDNYNILYEVRKIEGTINIPIGYVYQGIAIGRWLARQRNLHSTGKITIEKQSKLESLGIVWNGNDIVATKLKERWFEIFRLAEMFYKDNGHLRIPRHYLINNIDVGQWLTNLKGAYKGHSKRKIFDYQIKALESIGIEWNYDYLEDTWNKMYLLAYEYYNEFGCLNIPQGKLYKGQNLGNWLHEQRQSYRKSRLTEDKIQKLEALEIVWFPHQTKWNTYFQYAKKYYDEIGNLDIPYDFVIDGLNLGRWIGVQRQSYNGRQDTVLTQTQIDKLNSIEMIWNGNANTQTSYYEQMLYYYIKKEFPQTENRCKDFNFELDVYIRNLNIGIEYDGYYWHKDKCELDNEKDGYFNNIGVTLIRIREHGLVCTNKAINYILKDDRQETFVDMMIEVAKEQLGININPDIKKDAFEIIKGYKVNSKSPWYIGYCEAKQYYNDHGNLLVPKGYVSQSGYNLGKWIYNQRQSYKGHHRPIGDYQIQLLNQIGMIWDLLDYNWNIGYKYALAYYEEYGNLDMIQSQVYMNFNLGKWIFKQKYLRIKSKSYSIERIEKLDRIGMSWDCKKREFRK